MTRHIRPLFVKGQATTDVSFAAPAESEGGVEGWHEDSPTPAAASAPVQAIVYELITAAGESVTCTAEPSDPVAIRFAPHSSEKATMDVTVAPDCIEPLEAAAADGSPEAFFVRCDQGTTTQAAKIPGLHKISDITLKRGVINATGEPTMDLHTD